MANEIINVDELNRLAVKYGPVLRELPYFKLEDELKKLKIAFYSDVKEEMIDIVQERKGGLSKPYAIQAAGTVIAGAGEIAKVLERRLKPEDSYISLKDNIKNLQGKRIATNTPEAEMVNKISKEHPLKSLILLNLLKTISEDIVLSLPFAKRDITDKSPMGMFDGYFELIDKDIATGIISEANGNLFLTGSLTTSNGFSKICEFIDNAHPMLRMNNPLLYLTSSCLKNAKKEITTDLQKNKLISTEEFIEYIRQQTDTPTLEVLTSPILGTGDRLILTQAFNFETGMNTKAASEFALFRNIEDDPNWVNIWAEWGIGNRLMFPFAKNFLTNDGTNSTLTGLMGDYRS